MKCNSTSEHFLIVWKYTAFEDQDNLRTFCCSMLSPPPHTPFSLERKIIVFNTFNQEVGRETVLSPGKWWSHVLKQCYMWRCLPVRVCCWLYFSIISGNHYKVARNLKRPYSCMCTFLAFAGPGSPTESCSVWLCRAAWFATLHTQITCRSSHTFCQS